MDVVIQVISFSLIVLFLYMVLNETKSNSIASLLTLVSGILVFLLLTPYIKEIIDFMRTMTDKVGMDIAYVQIVMKIIAIAYLSTFCCVLCKDAKADTIATKVEFAGKIMIMLLAIPIMMNVLDSILKIL